MTKVSIKMVIFCHSAFFPFFNCVDPYSEYGSGSPKLLTISGSTKLPVQFFIFCKFLITLQPVDQMSTQPCCPHYKTLSCRVVGRWQLRYTCPGPSAGELRGT